MSADAWKARFERERAARKEAERLLETKSHELWEANQAVSAANQALEQGVLERTRALEEATRLAERASLAKSQFLVNMSHELRTPMNGVIGAASLLAMGDLDLQQKGLVETIDQSANGLLGLLNEILDLSKVEAGKLELDPVAFDLPACLSSVMAVLTANAEEAGLYLELQQDPKLVACRFGDPTRLRQVLINLVGNAIKFTSQGYVRMAVVDQGSKVAFTIEDTGIGIPAEKQGRIFEAFEQADSSTSRRFGGTGLGLAISHRLVGLMGGELTLESEEGRGSTFSFTLPLIPVQGCTIQTQVPQGSRRQLPPGSRVLVAEDNRVNQAIVSRMLTKLGCDFELVENGELAVQRYREESWDLVLLDWHMPVMTGLEAVVQIRAHEALHSRPHTPVLALTAAAMRGDREACLEAGMDGYLSKPIRYEDLAQALLTWLGSGRRDSA